MSSHYSKVNLEDHYTDNNTVQTEQHIWQIKSLNKKSQYLQPILSEKMFHRQKIPSSIDAISAVYEMTKFGQIIRYNVNSKLYQKVS